MVDGELFDLLSALAGCLREKSRRPFGGIQVRLDRPQAVRLSLNVCIPQLVITGDFFQLPPVKPGKEPSFAFESQEWKKCVEHTVTLTQVFRQKDNSSSLVPWRPTG